MLPSHFPEFNGYPHVHNFVARHPDMQFDDVRGMMKLPLPKFGIPAGCNFAAAAALCNLIGGISVVLYTPKDTKSGSGKRFNELVEVTPENIRLRKKLLTYSQRSRSVSAARLSIK